MVLGILHELRTSELLVLVGLANTPATAFPVPPGRLVAAAIECAAPGNRDVGLTTGIDKRRIAHELEAFPVRQHWRQVAIGFRDEFDGGALRDVQVNARPQVNRASAVGPFGHDDAAAARGRAGLNGLFKSLAAIVLAIADSAVVEQSEITVGNHRRSQRVAYACRRDPVGCGRRPVCTGRN